MQNAVRDAYTNNEPSDWTEYSTLNRIWKFSVLCHTAKRRLHIANLRMNFRFLRSMHVLVTHKWNGNGYEYSVYAVAVVQWMFCVCLVDACNMCTLDFGMHSCVYIVRQQILQDTARIKCNCDLSLRTRFIFMQRVLHSTQIVQLHPFKLRFLSDMDFQNICSPSSMTHICTQYAVRFKS